jgi:hypothetical protein
VESFRKAENIGRKGFKVYALVHIVPFILFKRKKWKKNKVKETLKLIKGIARSMTFISLWGLIGKFVWCHDKKISTRLSSKIELSKCSV